MCVSTNGRLYLIWMNRTIHYICAYFGTGPLELPSNWMKCVSNSGYQWQCAHRMAFKLNSSVFSFFLSVRFPGGNKQWPALHTLSAFNYLFISKSCCSLFKWCLLPYTAFEKKNVNVYCKYWKHSCTVTYCNIFQLIIHCYSFVKMGSIDFLIKWNVANK